MIYKTQKSWQLSNFLDFVSKEGGKLHGVNFRSDRQRRVHQHQIKQLHCLCFGDDVREGLPRVSQLKMIKCNLSSQESEDTWRVVFGHLHLFLLIFTSVAFFFFLVLFFQILFPTRDDRTFVVELASITLVILELKLSTRSLTEARAWVDVEEEREPEWVIHWCLRRYTAERLIASFCRLHYLVGVSAAAAAAATGGWIQRQQVVRCDTESCDAVPPRLLCGRARRLRPGNHFSFFQFFIRTQTLDLLESKPWKDPRNRVEFSM